MTSSNAEFVQNWNEILRFRVKEVDLLTPNETFLTNALLEYLQQFNFNVPLLLNTKNSENSEIRLKFKIDLCAYIDHLYKLGGNEESLSFVYFDLIRPTPKKTAHLLKFLLNYLFFYNMMKKDIIDETENLIEKRNKIQDQNSKISIEIEKANCLAKNLSKATDEYIHQLPQLQLQLDELIVQERDQLEQKNIILTTLDTLKSRINEIKVAEENLRFNIVSEAEIENISMKRTKLETNKLEQQELINNITTNHKKTRDTIQNLEPLIEQSKTIMSIVNLDELDQTRKLENLCEEKQTEIQHKNVEIDKLNTLIIHCKKLQIENEEEINEENKAHAIFKHKYQTNKSIFYAKINKKDEECDLLHVKLHDLEDKIQIETLEQTNILNAANNIFEYLVEREPEIFQLVNVEHINVSSVQ